MNNSQSTPSLNQIFLKREQLKTIRDQLYTIQKQEDKTLQDYSSLEIDLQQKFNALRDCFLKVQIPNLKKSQKYNQINKEVNEIFENIMRQYDENKKLREKIVSNDHHNFIKINEEQNRASDARFKFDRDRLVYEKLKREHEVLEIENQELKELAESIRDEYISLNTQQKLFEDEFTRITLKLEGQKKKFDNLTEKYIELKQKNDILNQEREKREIVYKKRIEDALKKKDELQKYIDDIQKQQKQIDLKIESNTQIIEDLNYNRDRLNSEINKLVQISNRRKEQQDQYDLIITT
ncbi:hypothetical protein M9Y10_041455 [Tritrichomonas musculus]|uniref:Uncharacterized protein n=1 Tax=Tritrichomonas musculus TaxID=1915356 RepID=A0ABR2K5F9_9EUKA